MTLTAIFSILNNASIRRNICLNFRMFTRENKPLFWQKWTTDVFSYFRPPCWCPCTWAPTWRPILISINLCETLCQITRVWNTAQTWGLDRVLIYISSIACKFLDFIHWMVFDFYFDGVTVKTGNCRAIALNCGWIWCYDEWRLKQIMTWLQFCYSITVLNLDFLKVRFRGSPVRRLRRSSVNLSSHKPTLQAPSLPLA